MSVIVISVGTSLLQNLLDSSAELTKVFQGVTDIEIKVHEMLKKRWGDPEKSRTIDALMLPEGTVHTGFQPYITYFSDRENITANIGKRKNGNKPDLLPAELSSLFLYYYDENGNLRDRFADRLSQSQGTTASDLERSFGDDTKDRIILLCTETVNCVFCARLITEILTSSPVFNTKCELIEEFKSQPDEFRCANGLAVINKLDMQDPEDWITAGGGYVLAGCGFYNLRSFVRAALKAAGIDSELMIIRTGSYKELSANLFIVAAEHQIATLYLFEDSLVAIYTSFKDRKRGLTDDLYGGAKIHYC